MGECRAALYKTNEIVSHGALMCHGDGGFGQPPCQYVDECMQERGVKKRVRRRRGIKTPPRPRPPSTLSIAEVRKAVRKAPPERSLKREERNEGA